MDSVVGRKRTAREQLYDHAKQWIEAHCQWSVGPMDLVEFVESLPPASADRSDLVERVNKARATLDRYDAELAASKCRRCGARRSAHLSDLRCAPSTDGTFVQSFTSEGT